LKIIEEYYSPIIAHVVQDCLQYDPDERPTPAVLIQLLADGMGRESRK
jgi:hypothetical protein